jgi:hypothetical protein
MLPQISSAVAVMVAAGITSARAHEAGLLTTVEGEHHPELFHGTLGSLFEFEQVDGDDSFALIPAFTMGLHEHVGIGVSSRFTDEQGDFAFESVHPNIQLLWHPKDESIPIHFHLQLGYQFADEEGHDSEDEGHKDEEHGHEDEQAEEEEQGHQHEFRSAVHSHGLDLFTGRFEVDYRVHDTLFTVGVIGTIFDDGETGFGYSAQILQRIIDPLHLSLDAFGDIESGGYHEISGNVYYRPFEHLQLSAGVAFGLSDEAPDSVVRLGVIHRF